MIKFLLSMVVGLMATASLYAGDAEGSKEMVLDGMIEAYGGEEALSSASGYIQHWHVTRAADGVEGKETRRVTLPERLYVDLRYPDKEETRVLEGDVGIKIFDKRAKKQVFGPMLDAMRLQLLRVYNPLQLKKFSDRIVMVKESGSYILKLTESGIECDYYVDPKSFYIKKTVGKLKMGPTEMEFVTIYEDFTTYKSVLMPTKEVKYAGGVQTAVNRLLDTELLRLKKVSDHRYEPI